ncbi:MAG: SDR family oxidoreductase [Proteobacteria bacterium]|nr:SDR family oxidoreductase [Pseudomonadota bacterium]
MNSSKTWLVTGVAGFIGSHLLETLLKQGQKVIGLDNLSIGKMETLNAALRYIPSEKAQNFSFVKGDIRDYKTCHEVTKKTDYVLHQAALGNVPLSIEDPLLVNEVNVTGFLNILRASQENNVSRFVYASSSAVYGDSQNRPNQEDTLGQALSPYAVSKRTNELYGQVFHQCYGLSTIGLRYFNVFGPRQSPQGAYAAVIPLWIKALLNKQTCYINGDGLTTRDFCYIDNIIQANIKAALTQNSKAFGDVFNIALGKQTSLLELYTFLKTHLNLGEDIPPLYRKERPGDIKHSFASIEKAKDILNYDPSWALEDGLKITMDWFKSQKR